MVSLQHFRNYQLPILKILDILIQTKSSPKSQQTIIKQLPEKSQLPHKQSLNNILKNPKIPQTIIQQHPENPENP